MFTFEGSWSDYSTDRPVRKTAYKVSNFDSFNSGGRKTGQLCAPAALTSENLTSLNWFWIVFVDFQARADSARRVLERAQRRSCRIRSSRTLLINFLQAVVLSNQFERSRGIRCCEAWESIRSSLWIDLICDRLPTHAHSHAIYRTHRITSVIYWVLQWRVRLALAATRPETSKWTPRCCN